MRHGQEETRAGRNRGVFRTGKASSKAAIPRPVLCGRSVRLSPEDIVRGLLDARLRHRRGGGGADGGAVLPLGLDRSDLVAGVALVNVDEGTQSDPGQFSDPGRT